MRLSCVAPSEDGKTRKREAAKLLAHIVEARQNRVMCTITTLCNAAEPENSEGIILTTIAMRVSICRANNDIINDVKPFLIL